MEEVEDNNTETCTICLGDYEYLCELDCYLFREDDIKHFMCKQCVKRLFKSNRWYHRAKCPFCRHTIHRDVILNNSVDNAEANIDVEMEARNNYNVDHIQRLNDWTASIESWRNANHDRPLSTEDRVIGSLFLGCIAFGCFYYGWTWIGWICVGFAILMVAGPDPNNNELHNDIRDQRGFVAWANDLWAEWTIIYQERTVRRRVARPLHHNRNTNNKRGRNRKDGNVRRVRRADKHRDKIKSRNLKVNKHYQKHNKRFQNRSYR